MFGSVGPTELIIALVIILLLFGAKRVPELAKGLGTGVREFRKGTRGEDEVREKQGEKKEDEALTSGEQRSEARVEEDVPVEADKAEQQQR
ncbi:MAG TPA: twin-arginine translocase TatA/TatE family subunit [Rubrobacteraceae bacterium]|nr:twin-arginine translocase TatA/TatE family subunit [Rubrobacteraceae bacterium]